MVPADVELSLGVLSAAREVTAVLQGLAVGDAHQAAMSGGGRVV